MGLLEEATRFAVTGRYADALRVLDAGTPNAVTRTPTEVMRIELLERTGRYRDARSGADALLRSRLTEGQKSSCEWVLGRIDAEHGRIESAVTHLQRAISIALGINDFERASWAQCRLMILLSDVAGYESVGPILVESRRNVARSGNPQLLANLHLTIAQMEGKRGLSSTAERHAYLALEHLGGSPNVWLESIAEGNLVVASTLKLDFATAILHAHRAVVLAEESGSPGVNAVGLANLAVLFHLTGQNDNAVEYCQRALKLFVAGSEGYCGTLDTLASARLAQGRLEDCEDLLAQLVQFSPEPKNLARYVNRQALLTRSALLLTTEHYPEALRVLDNAIATSATAHDSWLNHIARLAKARALMHLTRLPEALAVLATVGQTVMNEPPDVFAFYEGTVACALLWSGDTASAQLRMNRAQRILAMLRHKTGEAALLRSWNCARQAMGIGSDSPDGIASQWRPKTVPPDFDVLESIAAIFCYRRAPLVASELINLFATTECIQKGVAISRDRQGVETIIAQFNDTSQDGVVERRLRITEERDARVELLVFPKLDARSLATFNAAATLVETLAQVECIRAEREQKTTLWPTDEPVSHSASSIIAGQMLEVMSLAQKVARTTVNVLITGESGTGKEIVARAIHEYSDRAQRPFVPFNCAAVPRDLIESQLFGHRRGAFTGADRDYAGVIRSARDGTLFLDEIGDLSLDLQPKLLRFLESGEISPLGEPSPLNVNVRIVAATNSNLEDAVRDGRFREDLFYRLNVVHLSLRPLRERRDEIPGLVTHFVARAAQEFNKGHLEIAEETLERLLLYRWPGNVRQLHNELRRMVALAEPNSTLGPSAISETILNAMPVWRSVGANSKEIAVSLHDKLLPTLSRVEFEMIKAALTENEGKVDAVAKALGISRKGLYLKRQRLGL